YCGAWPDRGTGEQRRGATRGAECHALCCRVRIDNAAQRDIGSGGEPGSISTPQGGRWRSDREYGIFLRQIGCRAESRLLCLEGGDRRHHPLPRGGMGARQHFRHRHRAGLHRNGSQSRFSRERQNQVLARPTHTRRTARAAERGRPSRRCSVRRADRLFDRRNDLYRRWPRDEPLMKVFEQLERRRRWNEEEALILEQVRRVADTVIAPNAEHYDRTGEFPWKNIEALNALGLNGLFVPEAYGGAPMSYRLCLAVVKILAEACASTGIIYATNFHGMKPLIDLGTAEQKARLLPRIASGGLGALAITEPNAGSDAAGMQTRFTPDGDEIIVDGGKTFITTGDVADLILLFGKWSEIEDPRRAISVLILEKGTPGLEVVRLEDKMGHRAASTATL